MRTGTSAGPLAWARLVRPSTLLGASAAVAVGTAISGGVSGMVWPAMAATALAVAAANVFNDIRDIAVDAVNRPGRPLPAGAVTVENARRLGMTLAVVAVVVASTVGPLHAVWVAALVGVGLAYSWRLKRLGLIGNLVVAFLFANTILFGASVGGGIGAGAVVGALEVGLVVLGRELLKAVPDVGGDTAGGVRTVAVRWGWRWAAWGFVTVTSVSLLVAASAWLVGVARPIHVGAMLAGVVVPSVVIGRVVLGADSPEQVGRPLELTLFVWASGLAAVLLLSTT